MECDCNQSRICNFHQAQIDAEERIQTLERKVKDLEDWVAKTALAFKRPDSWKEAENG